MPERKPIPPLEDLRVMRWPEVHAAVGYSESRVRQLERAGLFPKRIALGDYAVGWLEHQIRAWLADRIENGRLRLRGCAAPAPAPKAAKPQQRASRKGA